ncbi:alcohol dehydrogenase [Candidatus Uabimicrobium amorphum]|uniref:Alcohol dehydrogenase n=2 Tax=Uabimicrobium amorphum TaxID=2596890 RepID=A0A5S9F1D7_UABAM|nr:alcohol dehydrogenase [Candidatus Uabimicrobium amorphum]
MSNGKLSLKKIAVPQPKPHHSLVKIQLAGICSTDIHLLHGYKKFSGIPGHEFVGVVAESDDHSLVGKRVVAAINIVCQNCDMCLRQMTSHCRKRRVLGILNCDGVHAQYAVIPNENLYVVPQHICNEQAVFIEPLAAACRILRQVEISSESRIAIVGDGKLGFMIATVLSAKKFALQVLGKYTEKLKIFRDLGIAICEGERDFDVVVECTGSKSGITTALQMLRPQGTLILKSTYADMAEICLSDVVVNEIRIIGSRCGSFADAFQFIDEYNSDFSPVIEKIYPLTEGTKAYEAASTRGAKKILLDCTS